MHQLEQLQRSFAVAKKDVWIYYAKGPVMVFGLIFPLFLLIAFTIGRNMTVKELFPGLMGMAIFFTSTAVGPAILPWEARSKTLERLVSSPVEVWALLLGDVFASFVFGLLISIIPLAVAILMGVEVVHLLVFGLGMILATFCFASLSILLSVYPPTDVPATVMMLSSLVRFPLVFISGVFVPVEEMPAWGQTIASASPLTYFIDLTRYSTTGVSYYSLPIDLAVLAVFTLLFLVVSIKLHERFLPQRLS
jgi:ABC-2 type transport system permease protein